MCKGWITLSIRSKHLHNFKLQWTAKIGALYRQQKMFCNYATNVSETFCLLFQNANGNPVVKPAVAHVQQDDLNVIVCWKCNSNIANHCYNIGTALLHKTSKVQYIVFQKTMQSIIFELKSTKLHAASVHKFVNCHMILDLLTYPMYY